MKKATLVWSAVSLLIVAPLWAQTFTSSTASHATAAPEGVMGGFSSPSLKSPLTDNWTNYTNAPILASPKFADITGDSVDEILLTTYDVINPYGGGYLYAWDGAGNAIPGFPLHMTGAPPGTPAIGDLDHDGDLEIVQGTWNYLYVFHADGTPYPGWPLSLYITQAAALSDLDGDGDLEIIVPVSNQMRVYHHNGTPFAGFPVTATHDLTAASVGDLDGDGTKELVAGSFVASGSPTDYIYAWHSNGTAVSGFPFITAGSVKVPPALADLDNNGTLEIIADCWSQSATDFLYVLNHTGVALPGWPQNLPYIRLSSPSVADLDQDGDLEIIVGGWSTSPSGEKVHAHHHTGVAVTGFPVVLPNSPSGNVNSTCTVGNLDGDSYPEIVIKAVNNIFALNHSGTLVPGFPVYLDDTNHTGTTSPTPALGDPDGDGLAEIFAASCFNMVMLIDQSGAYNPQADYWSTFRRDPQNTGTLPLASATPNLIITMTPINPPIVIPASGGSFSFQIQITNNDSLPHTFGTWVMVLLPNGQWYGPVLSLNNVTIPTGATVARVRTQLVPGNAPGGQYAYVGYVGQYPAMVYDSSYFNFTKLGDGEVEQGPDEWRNTGEEVEEVGGGRTPALQPESFLVSVSPNPFNPTTTISFELRAARVVKLEVFDVKGRVVGAKHFPNASPTSGSGTTPTMYGAGVNQITFDGSALPSGVYVYRLQAGEQIVSGKMVLLK